MSSIEVPHVRAVLARMAGSSSLACWIVLLMPQLIEQWRVKSSDGIAIGFLSIWILGDITNLAGAVWGGLRAEVVLLALWYCFADSLIMASYFYYKNYNKRKHRHHHHHHHQNQAEGHTRSPEWQISSSSTVVGSGDISSRPTDTRPLLDRRESSLHNASYSCTPEPGMGQLSNQNNKKTNKHHHHHHHHHHKRQRRDSLSSMVAEASSHTSLWQQVGFPIIFVVAAGILGYVFSSAQDPNDIDSPTDGETSLGPQILGYASAILYLTARIPQILQNHRRRSVEGLSFVFFVFSLLGNITYAAGILIYRTDAKWIKLYFSWLLGSLGTIFEDAIIFMQFHIYKNNKSIESDSESDTDDNESEPAIIS